MLMYFLSNVTDLQEPETEICASMLDSLNECIQVLPHSFTKFCYILLEYGHVSICKYCVMLFE